jgi:hypothetical protein
VRRVLPALILLATLPWAADDFLALGKLANAQRSLAMEQRKASLFGAWYVEARALRDSLPPGATVDFVMTDGAAGDIAVLAAAELQPHDVRFFEGWDAWRARERAIFLRDEKAANAPNLTPPALSDVVVAVSGSSVPHLRVVSDRE